MPPPRPDDGTDLREGYRVHLSVAARDPRWDAFLEATPGGHHLQSSSWGQVKAFLGWRAARMVVTRDADIRGGVEILLRRL
jgi:hypothetical protein